MEHTPLAVVTRPAQPTKIIRHPTHLRLPFTRLLSAVMIANFITLVVMNLFELPVYSAVFVLIGGTVAGLQLFAQMRVHIRRPRLDRLSMTIAVVTLALLTLPRLFYLLQWLPGTEVRVTADDYARLAELASMTLSSHYPLRHPSNADYLFSFYYTALYPLAALKFIVPVLTLKDVLILGNFFYHALVLGSVVETAHVFFARVAQIRWFVFFCTLFAGFDWLEKPLNFLSDSEWWQKDLFTANTQVSSFFTAMYWVIHHYLAFYALVLAAVWLFHAWGRRRWPKPLAIALLGASAFYSSPFSVLALPFYAVLHWRLLWRHVVRTWMFAYVVIMGLVPMSLFMGRLPESTFIASTFRWQVTGNFWFDKLISLPIYVIFVPLVEFAGVPFLLLLVWQRMSGLDRRYYLMSWLYFLLTYLIAFVNANNFSMRGMLLPSFVFFYLFAKYSVVLWPRRRHAVDELTPALAGRSVRWVAVGLIAGVVIVTGIGGVKVSAVKVYDGWNNTSLRYDWAGEERPKDLSFTYRDLVFDRSTSTYTPKDGDRKGRIKYNTEKLIEGLTLEDMADWERELVRFPRQGFY